MRKSIQNTHIILMTKVYKYSKYQFAANLLSCYHHFDPNIGVKLLEISEKGRKFVYFKSHILFSL